MKTFNACSPIEEYFTRGNSPFFVMVILLVIVYLAVQPVSSSIEYIQHIMSGYDSKIALYAIAFIVMLLCALTPLPAEIIAISNALVFSPAEAFLVTWISALASSYIGYEFGRLNGFDPCKTNAHGKICQLLNRYGYSGLAVMRLIPVVPFFALNICGGLFKLDRSKYLLITTVTIIPAVALLTFFPRLFL